MLLLLLDKYLGVEWLDYVGRFILNILRICKQLSKLIGALTIPPISICKFQCIHIFANNLSGIFIFLFYFILFYFILFYLFMRNTEKGRDIGRERSRLPTGSLMWDIIPRPWDHDLNQRQTFNHQATQVLLNLFILNKILVDNIQLDLSFYPLGKSVF